MANTMTVPTTGSLDSTYPHANATVPLRFLLLYGESLMVVLHLWILLGVSLPSLDTVNAQPKVYRFMYILCDASLPILAEVAYYYSYHPQSSTKESSSQMLSSASSSAAMIMAKCLIAVHTVLYAAFAWDETNMENTMIWAYSPWSHRDFPGAEAAAVCLDAICHGWGLFLALQMFERQASAATSSWTVCAIGAAVGACMMAYLSC